jgi:hypothetical protein
MRALTTTLTLIGLVLAMTAEAAAPLTPLVAGWESFFTVQTVGTGSAGVIRNTSDWSAQRIQLLVERLDAAGQPLDQRVMWLGADLPAGAHAYFDAALPPSASYRVRVFAFILETTAGPR